MKKTRSRIMIFTWTQLQAMRASSHGSILQMKLSSLELPAFTALLRTDGPLTTSRVACWLGRLGRAADLSEQLTS